MSKLKDSLTDLIEVTKSEYPEESMAEYIEEFARSDEVLPSDRTLGFVVLNNTKKVISLSFSEMDKETRGKIDPVMDLYKQNGFDVDLDLPN